jgi:hypothetical protein
MAAQYPDAGFDFGDLAISGLLYFAFASWLRWGRSRFAAIILQPRCIDIARVF